jgi:U3 small nucleolar RNA-associated protein 20
VFARKAESLAASLPLLLHHWNDVADLWLTAVDNADDEAMRPLLECALVLSFTFARWLTWPSLLQKLAHDLRGVLSPRYPELLARLFVLLPRALPAATLTALLGTLSALFKFLLLPAAEPDLLEATWTQFREVLPRCNHEVQRAAAEAWGAVLRRAKAALRPRAIELLVEGLDGIDDAAAWTIVFACKVTPLRCLQEDRRLIVCSQSVSQTLHTATPALLGPLFDAYLAIPDADADAVHTLVRRTLTALAHHCTSPAEFAPVAQLLVGALARETGAPEAAGKQERMRRALELVFMSCAVRGGARLTRGSPSSFELLTTKLIVPVTQRTTYPRS